MFKFIHAADIHLDSPLRGLAQYPGAPVEQIRGASRRALENLVDLAIREKVAFVLIAGDLYDRDRDDYNIVLFFNQQMKRLDVEGIRVFVIRGNHDAANRMTTRLNPPPNVTVFSDDEPLSVDLDDWKVMLHGQGFATESVKADLSRGYPPGAEGYFNIGLLHTCAGGGVEGHDDYAACNYDVLKSKRYQYWAFGHVHQHGPAFNNGDETIQFSGVIQGRSVRETGPKGCLMVTVDDQQSVSTEFRALDVLRWEICSVDASGAETPEEVLDLFARALSELKSEGRPLAVRVEFRGECPAHVALATDALRWTNEVRSRATQESGEQVWVEKVKLLTTAPPGGDDLQLLDGPVGELTGLASELQSDPDQLAGLSDELSDLTTRLDADLDPDERQDFLPEGAETLGSLLGEARELLTARLLERGRQT